MNFELKKELTHPQKRIWYTEKKYSDTTMHTVGGYLNIYGKIDVEVLKKSIKYVVKSNDILRVSFIEEEGKVFQIVKDYEKFDIEVKNFDNSLKGDEKFELWIKEISCSPFNKDNFVQFYIFKKSENEYGIVAKLHHIIADGWSFGVLSKQIGSAYDKFLSEGNIEENEVIQYWNYLETEKKYINSDKYNLEHMFWKNEMRDLPECGSKYDSLDFSGVRKEYELNLIESKAIKDFCKKNNCSLNLFYILIYLIYVYRTTGENDIIFGNPIRNRINKEEKNIIGMFTSTVPIRINFEGDVLVSDLLLRLKKEVYKCIKYQRFPYDELIKEISNIKQKNVNLFDVCINYNKVDFSYKFANYDAEFIEFYPNAQYYPMQILIKEWNNNDRIKVIFDYRSCFFDSSCIDVIFQTFKTISNSIIVNLNNKVDDVEVLNFEEYHALVEEFNNTKVSLEFMPVHKLFENVALNMPHEIALECDNNKMSYMKLNTLSNQLANYLSKNGVKKGDTVGIFINHSFETFIGILAVLKVGGNYLPIDCSYPQDRIEYIINDSKIKFILRNTDFLFPINVKSIDIRNTELYNEDSAENINNIDCCASDHVYTIYTSGSTGKPKGVKISHGGLFNYIVWAQKQYTEGSGEVFPLYSSLSFDLTVTSIFVPLISGGKVVIYPPDKERFVLYNVLEDEKITVIKLTPAHLLLMDNIATCKSLKRIIVGGDDLKTNITQKIFELYDEKIEIINEYGPTETVVGCMIYRYNGQSVKTSSIPIGKPADNVQIFILDKNLKPVNVFTEGEIYISGDGVGLGYVNLPELTNERFVDNPFNPNTKMYKTGDIAKFIDKENILYIGRVGNQIKINGYRIEIGEIENVLQKIDSIKDAVVNIRRINGKEQLCAYLVTSKIISEAEIEEKLEKQLPYYMIPKNYIFIDNIPLTINGKVDEKFLLNLEFVNEKVQDECNEVEISSCLIEAISEELKIDHVKMNDNFYNLGGDSISAIRIISKMNEKGYSLKLQDILNTPVIMDINKKIVNTEKNKNNKIKCSGYIDNTPIISWFFFNNFQNNDYYVQSIVLSLDKAIKKDRIDKIYHELIINHDTLRLRYDNVKKMLFYSEEVLSNNNVDYYDLSIFDNANQYIKFKEIVSNLKKSFKITETVLLKCCYIKLADNEYKLIFVGHHLIIDGISWRIILDDIQKLLTVDNYNDFKLPNDTTSYQIWSEQLRKITNTNFKKENNYWNEIIKTQNCISETIEKIEYSKSKNIVIDFDEEETKSLNYNVNYAYKTKIDEIIITAFGRTFGAYYNKNEFIIEIENHGRNLECDIDLSRCIGWFTNIYPLIIKFEDYDIKNNIIEIKESIRKMPNYGIGYGALKYIANEFKIDKKIDIRFNYMGIFDTILNNDVISVDDFEFDMDRNNKIYYIIDINCYIINKKLKVNMNYHPNYVTENDAQKLCELFRENILQIIDFCTSQKSNCLTPSDFDSINLSREEIDDIFD